MRASAPSLCGAVILNRMPGRADRWLRRWDERNQGWADRQEREPSTRVDRWLTRWDERNQMWADSLRSSIVGDEAAELTRTRPNPRGWKSGHAAATGPARRAKLFAAFDASLSVSAIAIKLGSLVVAVAFLVLGVIEGDMVLVSVGFAALALGSIGLYTTYYVIQMRREEGRHPFTGLPRH